MDPRDVMTGGHPAGSGRTKAVVQGPKGQQGTLVRGQGRGSTNSSNGSTKQWEGLTPACEGHPSVEPPGVWGAPSWSALAG